MKPWLLLDVDGPLNPYAAPWFLAEEPEEGYEIHWLTPAGGQTYRVALNLTHGEMLRGLEGAFDLAWATTWEHDANRLIAPIVGLPSGLPVVPLPRPAFPPVGRLWKTEMVADWVGERPFAWVDDEIDAGTREWLAGREGLGRHLAHRVEPDVGLAEGDIEALRAFANAG